MDLATTDIHGNISQETQMNWRLVLEYRGIVVDGNVYTLAKDAKRLGYEFIAYNAEIFFVDESGQPHLTRLKIADIEPRERA